MAGAASLIDVQNLKGIEHIQTNNQRLVIIVHALMGLMASSSIEVPLEGTANGFLQH